MDTVFGYITRTWDGKKIPRGTLTAPVLSKFKKELLHMLMEEEASSYCKLFELFSLIVTITCILSGNSTIRPFKNTS